MRKVEKLPITTQSDIFLALLGGQFKWEPSAAAGVALAEWQNGLERIQAIWDRSKSELWVGIYPSDHSTYWSGKMVIDLNIQWDPS